MYDIENVADYLQQNGRLNFSTKLWHFLLLATVSTDDSYSDSLLFSLRLKRHGICVLCNVFWSEIEIAVPTEM
jgi:hypothetical protein